MVDAVDYKRFVDKWDDNVKKAKDGILFFDNVQKLLPDRYSNQVNPLDKLFVEMDHWDDGPIVVISGLTRGLEDFITNNPAVSNRFKYSSFYFDYIFFRQALFTLLFAPGQLAQTAPQSLIGNVVE